MINCRYALFRVVIALLSLLFMASLASESRSAEVDAGVLAAIFTILDYVTTNSDQWSMENQASERENH